MSKTARSKAITSRVSPPRTPTSPIGKKTFADTRIHGTTKRQVAVHFAQERIALFPLSSHSPERNSDEYLNGDLKSELGRKTP